MSRAVLLLLVNVWVSLVLPAVHAGTERAPGDGRSVIERSSSAPHAGGAVATAEGVTIAAVTPAVDRHHPAECALCRAADIPGVRANGPLPTAALANARRPDSAPRQALPALREALASARAPPALG